MNALTRYLTADEKDVVSSVLKRLFVMHDRPASDEKVQMFIDEIQRFGYEAKHVIAGIEKLYSEDLRGIRLSVIRQAIEEVLPPGSFDPPANECACCANGVVCLFDQASGYRKAFACVCDAGARTAQRMGMERWSGTDEYRDGRGTRYVTENLFFGYTKN